MVKLPLSDIVTSHSNPRKQFNNIESLAQTIESKGLLQPITVNKFGNCYKIVMGNRRYLACKSLGWSEIPCIIIESTLDDNDWYMLIENIQRDDLSEVEKAETLKEILSSETTYCPLRDIGKKLGVHFDYVRHLLNLAGFPTEVKQMVKCEEITAYQARPLSQLGSKQEPPTEQLQIKVAEHIRDNHLNYDGAKDIVQRINDLPPEVRGTLSTPEVKVYDVIAELCKPDEPESNTIVNSWETFLSIGQQMYDLLERKNVKNNINTFNRVLMKKYLLSLKERINILLEEIDYI